MDELTRRQRGLPSEADARFIRETWRDFHAYHDFGVDVDDTQETHRDRDLVAFACEAWPSIACQLN